MLHYIADDLRLNVIDWGQTDGPRSPEAVTIQVELDTAGKYKLMTGELRTGLRDNKVKDVHIILPSGSRFPLRATDADRDEDIIQEFGLGDRDAS